MEMNFKTIFHDFNFMHDQFYNHEIGHIILNQHHDQEADHLMSEGRKGNKISEGQCQTARNFINRRFNQEEIKQEVSTKIPEATEVVPRAK
ncbi:MAG: hypothetical protein JNL11_07220 [Bdellovibrionaceae bacterium]|nr:hypothetical protein [Pseudobdellovibrionaceae bacterium]